ncbi:MAG: dockerin type I repeat-containing protein [Prevotella sp.]|nr:dockerin type I repeat-containing protein [Prevotella sp.]
MRQSIFIITLLLCSISGVAVAQDYKTIVTVAGHDITDQYLKTTQHGEGISGTVCYDRSENTLYLEDATITTDGDGIVCHESLTIAIKGTVTLKTTGFGCDALNVKSLYKDVIIKSSVSGAKFNMTSSYGYGIHIASYSKLSISGGLTVTCEAKQRGIYSGDAIEEGGHLHIGGGGTLKVKGEHGSVVGLGSLNAEISSPSGAIFNDEQQQHQVLKDGAIVTTEVTLVAPTYYNVAVAGTQFSSANAKYTNSKNPYIKSGYVHYSHSNGRLTMSNATIDVSQIYETRAAIDILDVSGTKEVTDIYLIGDNKIIIGDNPNVYHGIFAQIKNMNIRGAASGSGVAVPTLTIEGGEGSGIYSTNGNNADPELYIGKEGYISPEFYISGCGWNAIDANGDLHFYKTKAVLSSVFAAINAQGNVSFEGCDIASPSNAYYDETKKYSRLYNPSGNHQVCTSLTIDKVDTYGLVINGREVNSGTKDNITFGVKSGKVWFNDELRCLYLDNADIEGGVFFMRSGDNEKARFVVRLKGSNRIEADGFGAIMSNANLLICSTGEGGRPSLTLDNKSSDHTTSAAIMFAPAYTEDNVLGFNDVDVVCNYSSDLLGVENSKISFYNTNLSTSEGIKGFGEMSLGKCYIYTPQNGYYDTTNRYVCSESGAEALKVIIKAGKKLLRGDINGDGFVNTTDVTVLYNVIFGTDTTTDRTICDLDGKGDINTTDVTELYNIIFGTAE